MTLTNLWMISKITCSTDLFRVFNMIKWILNSPIVSLSFC
jgi:hypothetical protein